MAVQFVKDGTGVTVRIKNMNYRLVPVKEEIIRCIISKKEIITILKKELMRRQR